MTIGSKSWREGIFDKNTNNTSGFRANIEGTNITTAPKRFTNYNLF